MQVKKWTESKKTGIDTESRVTKRQLKEKYFWDDEMIENTWKWARENNRIIRHPISGGEFVDIDVEHLKKVTNETGSRMTQ
ncbi:unnamed protein product, partial [Durusdinium trenchii]